MMQSKILLLLAGMVCGGFLLWASMVFAGKADAVQFVASLQPALVASGTALLALINPKQ